LRAATLGKDRVTVGNPPAPELEQNAALNRSRLPIPAMCRSFAAASGIALLLGCAAVHAASRIVPAQPYAFDPVNLRMTVDSCVFAQDRVAVSPRRAPST